MRRRSGGRRTASPSRRASRSARKRPARTASISGCWPATTIRTSIGTGRSRRAAAPRAPRARARAWPGARAAGPDLVEQQRSTVGAAKKPGAGPIGPREGAAAIPEQLPLGQPLGERRAVDRRERPRPATPAVQRPGDHLLAGPGLPLEDDRQIARRRLPQRCQHRLQRRAAPQAGRDLDERARVPGDQPDPTPQAHDVTETDRRLGDWRPVDANPIAAPEIDDAGPCARLERRRAWRRETSLPVRQTVEVSSRPIVSSPPGLAQIDRRNRPRKQPDQRSLLRVHARGRGRLGNRRGPADELIRATN